MHKKYQKEEKFSKLNVFLYCQTNYLLPALYPLKSRIQYVINLFIVYIAIQLSSFLIENQNDSIKRFVNFTNIKLLIIKEHAL